jgi:hypothetical protein
MKRLAWSPRLGAGLLAGLASILTLQLASAAWAQLPEGHPPAETTAGSPPPPPPRGPATIRGQVVLGASREPMPGVAVALYGLSTSGGAGVAGVDTDAEGRFEFRNVSNQADTMYIVGAQHREVPFGQRVRFAAGQLELQVEIEVSEPTADASELSHPERRVRLEWLGNQLMVRESHQLVNAGNQVIFIGESERDAVAPLFRALLPPGHTDFTDGGSGVQSGDVVAYWGPFYPGSQDVTYQYLLNLPVATSDEAPALQLPLRQAEAVGRVLVLVSPDGPQPSAPGLVPDDQTVEIDGTAYLQLVAQGPAPGQQLDLTVKVPSARFDPDALQLGRVDYWLDMDDTTMKVTGELEVVVEGATRLRASGDEPLLRLPLPEGAELIALSPSARGLGILPEEGGLVLRGPIPPGKTNISYGYRIAVHGEDPSIALRFSRPVGTLNLLIADTGLAVESDRLHRRRPFKSGTRLYLHRQAYRIDAGEEVRARFDPLERSGVPRRAALAGVVVLTTLATLFMVAPLRRGARQAPESQTQALTNLTLEREIVYDSIRDLQSDFEMGKIEAESYERIHKELRAEAVELLRRAKASEVDEQRTAPSPPAASLHGVEASSAGFCHSCGGALDPSWHFCSHCGQALESDTAESGA